MVSKDSTIFLYSRQSHNPESRIKIPPHNAKTLSKLQQASLQSLEEISKEENNTLSYDLQPGDIVFFDNHRILHGRTVFEDYEDENKRRFLLRTWIKFDSSE